MRPFEYASPRTEQEAVELLNDHDADTAVLAGGTDLLNLMKQDLLAPKRVVDIKNIDSMKTVSAAWWSVAWTHGSDSGSTRRT